MRRTRATALIIVALAILIGSGCGGEPADPAVVVPDVAGLTGDAAQERLAAAGLTSLASVRGPAARAQVVDQDPAAGQRVPAGSVVAIELASGLGVASRRP